MISSRPRACPITWLPLKPPKNCSMYPRTRCPISCTLSPVFSRTHVLTSDRRDCNSGPVCAIQQLESNLITPIVMAKVADVHPFVTLFAILLFGSLFGFLGVLLALPLVLLFWTFVQVLWVERAIHAGDDRIPPIVDE